MAGVSSSRNLCRLHFRSAGNNSCWTCYWPERRRKRQDTRGQHRMGPAACCHYRPAASAPACYCHAPRTCWSCVCAGISCHHFASQLQINLHNLSAARKMLSFSSSAHLKYDESARWQLSFVGTSDPLWRPLALATQLFGNLARLLPATTSMRAHLSQCQAVINT